MKLHLPYYSEKTTTTICGEIVEIKAFQIIVWVSVSTDPRSEWDTQNPRLPAILDIGHNHNFTITEAHLLRWSGIHVAALQKLRNVKERGEKIPLCKAGLWLHSDSDPFKLSIIEGIAVHPGDWPRLPILGLRALTNSKLQTFIYGDAKQVIIRTPPPWYWPF